MNYSACTMNQINRQWQPYVFLGLCIAAINMPNLASAAGWEIDPIRIELSQQQQTAALTVKNSSDQPTSIQIRAVEWTQQDGRDIYKPTKELLVSPPIFTIAPKSEQIVRVALRREADSQDELTYRISLQELPPKLTPDFMGVKVALRVSLPVFVQSQQGGAAAKMAWDVSQLPGNQLKATVSNSGNAHVQISDFSFYVPGDTKPLAGEAGSSYVLAGQRHEWLLQEKSVGNAADNHLRLTAFTDAYNVDAEIVLHKQ